MPLPPPPEEALIMMGQPSCLAASKAVWASWKDSRQPGVTGTPASIIVRRAWLLLPMRSMTSGAGPTKTIPLSRHILAKVAFSERKP